LLPNYRTEAILTRWRSSHVPPFGCGNERQHPAKHKTKEAEKTSLNQCPADNYFAQQNTCLSCDTTNIIVKQP
jgi:hypothetical protein